MKPNPRFFRVIPGGKILLATSALLLTAALRADHEDFVVISASASKAYAEHKFGDGSPKPETYVLYEGKFFGGAARDPSIGHASFAAIARTLAPDLARQNYLPTPDASSANLLIVINWGTTITDPLGDKNDLEVQGQLQDLVSSVHNFNLGGGGGSIAGLGALNANLAMSDTDVLAQQSQIADYSRLLGYGATLQREGRMDWARPGGMSALEASHVSELLDERYFVILLAYDYQKILREDGAHDGRHTAQPKPLWSVRMNIRSAGNNFNAALPAMGEAASSYFGKQMDDLVTAQVAVGRQAHVDVGEPKVMNVIK
jgi:hypothetical protein